VAAFVAGAKGMNIEQILATIPGWENATVSVLDGGLTNRSYLLESGDRRAVLKTDAEPRRVPLNDRPAEARIQRNAARAGLANDVLYVDETTLLTEFVEGEVWTAEHFDDDERLRQLAERLRELHSLPLTGRRFDASAAAVQYAAALPNTDSVREHVELIASVPRTGNDCCCHNDLVAANIISTPEIRFLDWEYACDNDPLFDLATIVAHHELSEKQALHLFDAYFGGDGDRWRKQLDEQIELYRALLWLWSGFAAIQGRPEP
jgi:thiamine kinase-like enzyme